MLLRNKVRTCFRWMVAKAGEIITDLEREYGFGGVFLVASKEQERRYKHLLFLLVSKVEQWVRRTAQPANQTSSLSSGRNSSNGAYL